MHPPAKACPPVNSSQQVMPNAYTGGAGGWMGFGWVLGGLGWVSFSNRVAAETPCS